MWFHRRTLASKTFTGIRGCAIAEVPVSEPHSSLIVKTYADKLNVSSDLTQDTTPEVISQDLGFYIEVSPHGLNVLRRETYLSN
jgi:hypothetical protein